MGLHKGQFSGNGFKKGHPVSKEMREKIRESCRNCPVVHHINGDHNDDRPENRMILTPREHAQIHMLQGDLHIFKKGEVSTNKGKTKLKGGHTKK